MNKSEIKIGVIGLGYVGLPLAIEFSSKFNVAGFDIDKKRINELSKGLDTKGICDENERKLLNQINYYSEIKDLEECNFYIVTVPTPVDANKNPILDILENASKQVGSVTKPGDFIVYESTVYPGVTENICVPEIEKNSGLTFNKDFFVGYSPERVVPGDNNKKIRDILKITSGSTKEAAKQIDGVYGEIIVAGTYIADSIRVAEAAKLIENVQRDVNIALMNELFHTFSKIDLDINSVIKAASTKWNFMGVNPGLVGGHCISVDPYYLLHQSEKTGFSSNLIRTAREVNEGMPSTFCNDLLNKLITNGIFPKNKDLAILGFSFKENCPDIRNTKAEKVFKILKPLFRSVKIYDPIIDQEEAMDEYGIVVEKDLGKIEESIAFLAVPHDEIIDKLKSYKFEYLYDYRKKYG